MAYVMPRRRRRGLSGELPLCSELSPVSSNSYGPPTPCDDSAGPRLVYDSASAGATRGDVDALWQQVLSGQQQSNSEGSITQWVNNNVGTIALVVGGVLLVGMLRR